LKQAKLWLDIHGADLHRYGQTSATAQAIVVD
jgi:hypothetical protein